MTLPPALFFASPIHAHCKIQQGDLAVVLGCEMCAASKVSKFVVVTDQHSRKSAEDSSHVRHVLEGCFKQVLIETVCTNA